jgi:two-component system chemotaxis family response regulator WspR
MFDHLTGVANRRVFEEAMDREWYRAMRDKHTLSLVIADIDNFKRCNDNHGHEAGDQVLKSVAALLERHIRRGADLVTRIGGEEFAIILQDTDLNAAPAEGIRLSVPKLANSEHEGIPVVTMSFGASSLAPD